VLEYATVTAVNVSAATKCRIFGTIIKSDGTAAGKAGKVFGNSVTGVQILTIWEGIEVKISHPVVDVDSGNVVGTEVISTKTNAAGYFEIYTLQGLSVVLSCSALNSAIPIDSTGLSELDISPLI